MIKKVLIVLSSKWTSSKKVRKRFENVPRILDPYRLFNGVNRTPLLTLKLGSKFWMNRLQLICDSHWASHSRIRRSYDASTAAHLLWKFPLFFFIFSHFLSGEFSLNLRTCLPAHWARRFGCVRMWCKVGSVRCVCPVCVCSVYVCVLGQSTDSVVRTF